MNPRYYLRCEVAMPDGFSFRVSFGETSEAFGCSTKTGDAAGFREAYEAVSGAAAGRDEAEIRQLLAGELRSRNIGLLPDLFDLLAAGIAASDASITVGDWGEADLPHERPGLASSLIGDREFTNVQGRRLLAGSVGGWR